MIKWDARCLDAHGHLGMLAFEQDDTAAAQAHYATGVRIAESSLPDEFGGVLGRRAPRPAAPMGVNPIPRL